MSQYPNQWQNQQGGNASPFNSPPQKSGGAGKVLLILGLLVVLPIVLCCAGGLGFLVYVGAKGPDTYVVSGNQLRPHHRDELESLGLVGPDEEILLVYSDGLISVKGGVYFLTNENLVLYSDYWDDSSVTIPYDDINNIESAEDDFLGDLIITVDTDSNGSWSFPISSEQEGDEKFMDLLVEKSSWL